jgi:hypothetical protein
LLGIRQKVKIYFLPVYIAKKGKQSSPFFGGKARKPTTRGVIQSGGKTFPDEVLPEALPPAVPSHA